MLIRLVRTILEREFGLMECIFSSGGFEFRARAAVYTQLVVFRFAFLVSLPMSSVHVI